MVNSRTHVQLVKGPFSADFVFSGSPPVYKTAALPIDPAQWKPATSTAVSQRLSIAHQGCNALLASYRYRVRSGDGSQFETLCLATLGLAASIPKAVTLLETMREPVRNARNEAEYQRPGVTTAADLREILDGCLSSCPLWSSW